MGFDVQLTSTIVERERQEESVPADSIHRSCLTELVAAAQQGDHAAWEKLIQRFNPLVVAVIRKYRMSHDDAQDVRQTVWMLLYENIGRLREPKALPGWIKTTTRNEALQQLNRAGRAQPMDPETLACLPNQQYDPEIDSELLRFERDRAIHDGLAEIEPRQRKLLLLLHAQERPSYVEVGRALGMPTGSIGPTRARCLKKLRNSRPVKTFLLSGSEEFATAG